MSIKVLIVEDNESIRKMIWAHLKVAKMDVCEASDGQQALVVAKECKPDVVLLDIMMPVMDGIEACRLFRKDPLTASMYIIMLTAKARVEDKVEGLESGADDYLGKPFVPEELIARIKVGYKTAQERKSALFDSLTTLFNRRSFDKLFEKEWSRTQRYGNELSLLIVDIDHFKNVNDTYGHQVGDDVLVELASLLKERLRESDMACRWGGEEFVLFLPETPYEHAVNKAEELRKEVEAHDFPTVGKLTVSIGVSVPANGEHSKVFFERVDTALYQAKEGGRNKVVGIPAP